MGYYIQTPLNKNKAAQIVELYGGTIVMGHPLFKDLPEGKALICVVDNGLFEAAGFCFSEQEFTDFNYPDGRPRTWVVMERSMACELTGYGTANR